MWHVVFFVPINKADEMDVGVFLCLGHDGYRDSQRPDHNMHDSPSPASRERSSSLQGMDMASLPPRKRPWHDGPGTGDVDSPGAGPDDRGAGKDFYKIKHFKPVCFTITKTFI